MPLLIETNSTVVKINAAQPFMLIVVQSGSEKLATFFEMLILLWQQPMADGRAALDDLLKKAIESAGINPLAVLTGDIPFAFKKMGKTTKACTKLAKTTHNKYRAKLSLPDRSSSL